MIAAILLAALSPLTCNLPSEFFAATNGTEAVLDIPVPTECIYDFASPSGKVLRVTPSVAAFYYSFISAYLERELLFGYAHGELGGVGMPAAEAYATLKRGDLRMLDLESLLWLNDATNRVVWGLGRFSEGRMTQELVSNWTSYRMGRWNYYNRQGYIVPRYFESSDSARSMDFPELDYLTPVEINAIVNRDTLAKTWVTWGQLDDCAFRDEVSPPLNQLRHYMKNGCDLDDRPGSPYTFFGVAQSNLYAKVGESFTNVVEKLAPGCGANLTNATMRLDYRRLVAMSRLMSLDDRQIYPEAFWNIDTEREYSGIYTNTLDVTLTQVDTVVVTNGLIAHPAYDQDRRVLESSASISGDDIRIISSSFTAVTNSAELSQFLAAASCNTAQESVGNAIGGATFEYLVPVDDLKSAAQTGTVYRFAAYFSAEEYDDSVRFDMWHGSSPTPITPDLTRRPTLQSFQLTNITLRVRRWKEQNHCWTLSPFRIGEEGRIPTPLTHDTEAVMPDGSWMTYYTGYPKWLFATNSLVASLDLFYIGNVVTLFDEQTLYPTYVPTIGPDGKPLSEAYYFHKPALGLSYDEFFQELWNFIAETRNFAIARFTALAGSRPGEMGGPGAAESIAEKLSAYPWSVAPEFSPLTVIPQEARYDVDGNFYDVAATNTPPTPIAGVTIRLVAQPAATPTNTVGRAVSVGSHLSYLAGVEAAFKNLAPSSLRSAAPP